MQNNILKTSNITKVFLVYQDGKKNRKREPVKVRYLENKYCYFVGEPILNFSKPKWRAKADIVVYTPDGVYTANVIIRDVSFSLREMLYKLDLPKVWKYTQMRVGSRKVVNLPIKITFSDNETIETNTYDLSVGGFSVLDKHSLNTIQTRFECDCSITFPKDAIINFPDGILTTKTKFVRQKPITDDYELRDHSKLCFKFTNLTPDEQMILKHFLLKIN